MYGLARGRVYRNVERPQEWLGLEPFDALGLGAVAWLLMLINRHGLGWNVLVLMVGYGGLRVLKRGKSEGYTMALVRFYLLRRPMFLGAERDQQPAAHRLPWDERL